jgi:hypothetical protein
VREDSFPAQRPIPFFLAPLAAVSAPQHSAAAALEFSIGISQQLLRRAAANSCEHRRSAAALHLRRTEVLNLPPFHFNLDFEFFLVLVLAFLLRFDSYSLI